jgi:hypothetical protein
MTGLESTEFRCLYPVSVQVDSSSEFRADFVRRLFAVAVSVGFAAHVGTLSWIASLPTLSSAASGKTSALLILAMVTVVASWEGYLASIKKHPLRDVWRFYLDIVIVFEYLILMTLDDNRVRFVNWMCVIFVTYAIWDYVRILVNKEIYRWTNPFGAILPFFAGLVRGPKEIKGPSITLWWTVYFLILRNVDLSENEVGFWLLTLAMLYGVVMYRVDKVRRIGIFAKCVVTVLPLCLLLMDWIATRPK